LKQITREPGRQLITAGGPGQQVVEGPQWGHSVFTYFLLKGIKEGLADLNQDGIIPASELYAYLDGRVPAESEGQQRPELWSLSSEKGEFVFFAPADKTQAVAAASAPSRQAPPVEPVVEGPDAQEGPPAPIEEARVRPFTPPVERDKSRHDQTKTGKDGTSMLLVPGGEFTMGSGSAMRQVQLDAFYMDKYEVTASRYEKFLRAGGRREPDNWHAVNLPKDGNRPVTGVDWADAVAYCRWAGKRLPTEAEWEKAARGTDGRLYPWGNEPPNPRLANYRKDDSYSSSSDGGVADVGSYEGGKSPYGLYDMAGNVWEWVADWYDDEYYRHGPTRNPPGPDSGDEKVVRGGSWSFQALSLLTVSRLWFAPTMRAGFVGFRCAQDAAR
jgi:formylglycine-generating enzyme required for sulfatase activity